MLKLPNNYIIEEITNKDFNVSNINMVASIYKDLRQLSKSPTFALTFQGTWRTLVKNLGIPESEAKQIEVNYHNLYEVSDRWVSERQIGRAHV